MFSWTESASAVDTLLRLGIRTHHNTWQIPEPVHRRAISAARDALAGEGVELHRRYEIECTSEFFDYVRSDVSTSGATA